MRNPFTENTLRRLGRSLLALGALALLPLLSWGQAFTAGNLAVLRIGTGTGSLAGSATAVFIDEYTPGGTLVRSIALPTTVAATGQAALTLSGTSSSEGYLGLTSNGQYLAVPGYNSALGTSGPNSTTTTLTGGGTNNRVVGRVAGNGTFDTSTRVPDGFSGQNIRSAVGSDGTGFWATGSSNGVRYAPFGNDNATATTVVAAAPSNSRVVSIANGQLYLSAAATSYYGISSVGSGLPTTSGQTSTLVVGDGTTTAPYQYAFFDLDPTVAGPDVVYLAENTASAIQKWTYNGTAWTQRGSIALTNVAGLTAIRSTTSNAVTVYAAVSNSNSAVSKFTDPNTTLTGTITGIALTTGIAAPGSNKVFRGLALVPQTTPTPQVYVSTTGTLNAGSTAGGTAGGTVVSYDVSGQFLTSAITVTAPDNYEVSLSSGSGFGSSVTTANPSSAATGGLVAATRLYVRLSGGGSGTVTGNVTNTSGTATQSVAVTGSVTAGPTLATSTASLTGFSTAQGTASAAQTYTLTGSGLTANVTVTAPTGYEVSQDGTTYAATQTVTPGSGSVNTPIYVRLTAAATAGSYSGNVTNASTAATTQNVAVSGTVNTPTPTLTALPATLSAFNTLAGNPSAAQSYTLTGSNLTAGVTVTAPAGFEVSQDGGATYAATQTVAPSSGSVNTPIAVRLTGATAGSYSGNVTNASPGATTQNVAVTGRVVGKPTGTPAFTSAATTFNSVTLNITPAADGTNLLVVVRPNGSSATAPTDQTTYAGNTSYGAGAALGAGRVVYAGTNATSVTVTNLTSGTPYVADVYTYNVGTVSGFESYGLNSGTTTFTTPVQPPAAAGVLALEENFDYPTGTVLATSSSTPSATTGWQVVGATANLITTATGNLSSSTYQYPQGVLAAATPGTSTQVPMANNGQDIFKAFTRPSGATATYLAALLTVSAANTAGDYFLSFLSGVNTSAARGRVQIRSSGTGYNVGLTMDANSNTPVYGTTVYSLNTTYLLVLKYENTAATSNVDVASVYMLNPTTIPTSEPATPEATYNRGGATNDAVLLGSVQLRQGTATDAPTLTLDALRVGTGWGTAVGRPVYSSGSSTVAAGDYYSLRVTGSGTVATVSTTGPGNGVTAPTAVVLEKQLNLDGGQVAVPAATGSNPNPLLLRARNIVGDGFSILANGGTSYVDGPVSREAVGSPSLLFPVGRGGNYRPMTLNISAAPTGTTIYTGVQTESSAYNADGTVTAPLTRVSRVRYYTITPNPVIPPGSGTFQGTLQLSFGSDDGVSDPSLGSLVVAKSDGAGWASIGRSTNNTNTVTSDIFQDFSFFALGSTAAVVADNPLPVELTAFTAARAAKGVALAWTTASEKNSDYFAVERSLDGQKFEAVARVQAAGSSAQARAYASRDLDAPAAQLYYRLRLVDADGKAAYSPVVAVAAGPAGELTLSPNPAHDQLSVLTEQATAYVVRNPLGQVVRTGTTLAGAATTLDVSQLASGVYLLELRGDSGRTVRRFVKE